MTWAILSIAFGLVFATIAVYIAVTENPARRFEWTKLITFGAMGSFLIPYGIAYITFRI